VAKKVQHDAPFQIIGQGLGILKIVRVQEEKHRGVGRKSLNKE